MQSATPEDYKRISEFIFEAQTLSDQAADDLFSRRFPDGDLLRSQAERLWKRAKRIRSEDACSGFRTGEDLSVNGVELSRQLGSGGNGIVFSALQKSAQQARNAQSASELEKDRSMRTSEVYRRSMEILAKQLAQTSLQQRRALAEVYWELAQQGTGEPKLDATLVRRAIDYADETDPNLTQMKARYDALAKVNDFPQRGPELARGPSPLSLLRMQLQIARTQLDGDGKISDLDGLKSIVNKSFGLMKVDPEGAKAFRSSVCGSDATSKALRRSLSDLDRLCGLKMIGGCPKLR